MDGDQITRGMREVMQYTKAQDGVWYLCLSMTDNSQQILWELHWFVKQQMKPCPKNAPELIQPKLPLNARAKNMQLMIDHWVHVPKWWRSISKGCSSKKEHLPRREWKTVGKEQNRWRPNDEAEAYDNIIYHCKMRVEGGTQYATLRRGQRRLPQNSLRAMMPIMPLGIELGNFQKEMYQMAKRWANGRETQWRNCTLEERMRLGGRIEEVFD